MRKHKKRFLLVLLTVMIAAAALPVSASAASRLTASAKSVSLYKGEKKSITLKWNGKKLKAKKAKWSTSNKKVAVVKNGKVTAKKAGTAVITAKYGKYKATCKVTVKSGAKGGKENAAGDEEKTPSGKNTEGSAKDGTEPSGDAPAPNHKHTYVESITKTPTCTEMGTRTFTCSCGDFYTETLPAAGHKYNSEVTQKATCEEDGVVTFTCASCGDQYIRYLQKTGHKWRKSQNAETEYVYLEDSENAYRVICKDCKRVFKARDDEWVIAHLRCGKNDPNIPDGHQLVTGIYGFSQPYIVVCTCGAAFLGSGGSQEEVRAQSMQLLTDHINRGGDTWDTGLDQTKGHQFSHWRLYDGIREIPDTWLCYNCGATTTDDPFLE